MRLQHLVESAVARFGARPALKHDGRCFSFLQLDDAARGVADQLAVLGAQPESIVAVVMPKGIEQLVTVLGVLKAGCAFLPVDANYPQARQEHMLDACAVHFVARLGDDGISITSQAQTPARTQSVGADRLAYVIYTSGSTGTPCAVGVEHAGIINTVQWRNQYYEFTEQDRVLQIPSPSFDSSIVDVFCALSSGAPLVFINDRDRLNPAALKKLLIDEQITHLLVTPTYYKAILPVAHAALGKVRVITIAGEAFDKSLATRHFELLPDVRLVNEYGPTENSVCSLYEEIRPNEEILIGLPIPNVDCSVRDEAGAEVADSEAGELWLSGVGLARGYLNSQQLTELRFPADPFHRGRRAYRTGDRVRREASGKYRFLGRLDRQVKINGVRVDLLEIEGKIAECDSVVDVLVCAVGDATATELVAYYVPADAQVRTEDIRRSLEEQLPRLMIPSRIVALDAFPVSPNGKVDIQRLRPIMIFLRTGMPM